MKTERSKYSWKQYLKDYWGLLEGRRLKFSFFTLLMIIANSIPFAIAFILGKMIDFFINYNSGDSINQFYIFVGLIAFLGGFNIWLRFSAKIRLKVIGAEIRKEARITAMSKIMDLELQWNEKEETGSKVQKINQGGESIYSTFTSFMNEGLSIFTGLFGALILFIFLDVTYLIYSLIFISIYFCGEAYFNRKLNYWEDELNKIREKVSGKMHESASSLLTIKSLGLKESFRKSTSSLEDKFYTIWRKKADVHQMKFKTVKIFSALGYAGFILLIGLDVIAGVITAGSILIFVAYFEKLKGALDKVTNKATEFIKTKSSFGRFMTIFGIELIDREKDLSEISKNWKLIEFKNVTFKYKNKNVLENFNLKIKRNEKIGVVGKSGTGKSTITKLLLGLYKLQKGKILIDGKSITEYKHKSITDTIGVVLQDSEIFNSSLFNNITISSTKKDYKSFEKAIKVSELMEVIKKLPKGIHSPLGEKGYHLSGGERQRVGIARAIYKNNSMILLDEATSSLDSKTEGKIQMKIEKYLDDKTLLIIAHRLSTIKQVDKIVFMEKGKIIEQGTYEELLRKKGKFYALWKEQKAWKNA